MAKDTYVANASIDIHADPGKVWDALTNPDLIKQYFFGSEVTSDWKEGSPITYKGEYEGRSYEDKGSVVKVEPRKQLVVTHWSPMSGTKDSPENYHTVTYSLTPRDGGTHVDIAQDNNASEEERKHSADNWAMVLQGMKKLLER
jgi:uncharacterized protein YndB with AHSA1/START domain